MEFKINVSECIFLHLHVKANMVHTDTEVEVNIVKAGSRFLFLDILCQNLS